MSAFTFDSSSVQGYATILQNVISRMASNSSACKTWCITLVSAVIVIVADKGKPEFTWIAVLPIVLFAFLDSYYLSLEKEFRGMYNNFIKNVQRGTLVVDDLFALVPVSGIKAKTLQWVEACSSISVWPFYSLQLLMLAIMKFWIFN